MCFLPVLICIVVGAPWPDRESLTKKETKEKARDVRLGALRWSNSVSMGLASRRPIRERSERISPVKKNAGSPPSLRPGWPLSGRRTSDSPTTDGCRCSAWRACSRSLQPPWDAPPDGAGYFHVRLLAVCFRLLSAPSENVRGVHGSEGPVGCRHCAAVTAAEERLPLPAQ
ncbi:hypothetical protein HPB51_001858 [Rhipicephalus microplus]|uniref:Uncharacterized protein n=1 Tax=Rhipicephalus microplus TaxID=6941 RepID=A0A9J6D930_RHIMP|nr:hypothetical protein HPB51_001858 [Rhipicephalus microplus]